MTDLVFIPHVVIHPSCIVSYNEVISEKPRCKSSFKYIDVNKPIEEQSAFLKSTRKADGKVSKQASRKISKAIEYLVATSQEKIVREKLTGKYVQFRTAFLTLTLPSKQMHTDKEIISTCLNSFLTECRKHYKVNNYVWRAELQGNGNIHFHIILGKFIPWYEARNRWNRIVNKLGYVDKFQAKHGQKTPNSIDIHSTHKIKNIKAYLVKYMAKDVNDKKTEGNTVDNQRIQEGRIWGCNQELSKTRGLNLIVDSEIDTELKKVIDKNKVRKYEGNFFTVYFIDYHSFRKLGSDLLFKLFSQYLFDQLQFSEQLTFS